MKEKLKKLDKLINKSKRILLLSHSKMDGDAIWSLWTFYYILEKLWKKVKTTNEILPSNEFSFLWVNKIFEENLKLEKFNPNLIICFDTASVNQLWKIYSDNVDFFKWKEIVVIDHHISNTKFWTLNIVDYEASSTCEIVFHLIKKLWYWKYLRKKCINLLLTWIVTDTNIFYNKNTTSDTLNTASKLLELWGDLNKIIYNFYHKASYEKIKLKWLVFEKLQKNKDSKIIWAKLTKQDFEKTKTTENDTTWIINNLLGIDTCEIAIILYEIWNEVKVTFRSKTFDVWKFCSQFFWWGGHKLAAGFKSEKSLEEVEKEVLEKLKKSFCD